MQAKSQLDGGSNIVGRKSEEAERKASKSKGKRKRGDRDGSSTGGVKHFTRSSAVFGMLQDRRTADTGTKAAPGLKTAASAAFKL